MNDPYRLLLAPGRAALVLPALRPPLLPLDLSPRRRRLERWTVIAAVGALATAIGLLTTGAATALAGGVALIAGVILAAGP